MEESRFKHHPIILGVVIAMLIHSAAVLIRELSPIPSLASIIDPIALHPTWVYVASILFFIFANFNTAKEALMRIPLRLAAKTIEGQKLVLAYETMALVFLLLVFPSVAYFYSRVYQYVASESPQLFRFLGYMPIADIITEVLSSFPLFLTFFATTSLLCFAMPHSYLAYKYAKKAAAPLQSAINFSILLSFVVTFLLLGILSLSISPWMIIALLFVGPIILISFIVINIMMLRYHNKFIEYDSA